MDLIEQVAEAIRRKKFDRTGRSRVYQPGLCSAEELGEARAAIDVVIEACAQVAESELPGTPDGDWVVERIAHRIRSAPEDSRAHSELEKLAIPPTAGFNI